MGKALLAINVIPPYSRNKTDSSSTVWNRRRSRQRDVLIGVPGESETHRTAGGRAAGNVQTREFHSVEQTSTDFLPYGSGQAALTARLQVYQSRWRRWAEPIAAGTEG